MSEIIIAVRRDDVVRFGANGAIVLQQIRHYLDGVRGDWYEQTSDELARICGLSADQVRRAVKRLVDVGALERRKRRAQFGDHTLSYRPISCGDFATSQGLAKSPDPELAKSPDLPSPEELDKDPSPTPPVEGDDDPSAPKLFAVGGAVTARERKRLADPGREAREIVFERWWSTAPFRSKGSKAAALRAFLKALRAGATVAELDEQVANYVAARESYRAAWAHAGDFWPALMNGSTFLNGKRSLWAGPWEFSDLEYWPAPTGWSWDDRRVPSHDGVEVDEVPADVRAQGVRAMAKWFDDRNAQAVAGG